MAERLTEQVIGLAITVHRHTGPGMLETVYERCLCLELHRAGVRFERQVPVPVMYRGEDVGTGFRADLVVDGTVIVEVKAVAAILPVHEVQLRTYLRMSGLRVGLLLNFNETRLVDGLRRFVV
ncbi:MAG TPA: GxxExxY protein [Rhodopila sp.]|uniref:GxxExxY protein n=1 Tax=Rhodopila sp. TaxID=2480087 RepID=UPI002C5CCF65|nr:GxxExxY protein [Rhodopila sp.]HVY17854.1 GxxExxY protein [Rhodopila sp.]